MADEPSDERPPRAPRRVRTLGYEQARRTSKPAPEGSAPDPVADAEALFGAKLGERYRVDAVLGQGGMATVFRCHDEQLDRDVAVKVMHDAVVTDPELRARFEREAKVLAALSHPHIVSLLDFGVQNDLPFLVMELLPGRSLGELLADGTRLPWDRAVRLVTQMVGAVTHAHAKGFLHRDLKPDNVFLTELDTLGDHVRVLDFGFAKLGDAHGGRKLTSADRRFGTPRYLAPEQLTTAEADARADLYAIAVIFYQMLAGRRPFEGSIREVLQAKVKDDPPPLAEAAPDAPTSPALEAFFQKALARDRDARFEDAAAFLAALEALADPGGARVDATASASASASATAPAPAPSPSPSPSPAPAPAPATASAPASASAPAPSPSPSPSPAPSPSPSPRAGSAVPAIGLAVGGVAALAVVATACLATWALSGDEADASKATAAKPAPEPWLPPEAEVPAGGPEDPWDRPGVRAPPVAAARADVVAGLPLDGTVLRDLRRHAQEHPDDLHAQLLLGHVFARRGMRAMAVGAYERALRLDPAATGDPRLAVDLVALASEGGEGEGPVRVLRTYLPERARAVVERALAQAELDPARRRRLESLRERLDTR